MSNVAALPRQQTGVKADSTDGPLRLVGQDGTQHTLNPTARALWDLCDGQTTVDEMVWAVCRIFSTDRDTASLDVERILADLVDLDLLEWVVDLGVLENVD